MKNKNFWLIIGIIMISSSLGIEIYSVIKSYKQDKELINNISSEKIIYKSVYPIQKSLNNKSNISNPIIQPSYWFVVAQNKSKGFIINTILMQNHSYFSIKEALDSIDLHKKYFLLNFEEVSEETYLNYAESN